MTAMFMELLRIWAYIFFGACIMSVAFSLFWIFWHWHCNRLDKQEEMRERWIRVIEDSKRRTNEINRYRGERYYRDANEREPHGN